MTATAMTEEEFLEKYNITLVIPEKPDGIIDRMGFVVKDPNGTQWNYKTDVDVIHVPFFHAETGTHCEYILAKGASYVFIFNERKRILCTARKDYDVLAKIVVETIALSKN